MILAGDVGGTKTALAIFELRRRSLAVVRESVLPSQGYATFGDAIRQFLSEGPSVSIEAACVGVAGPVIDGRCSATNLPWVVDEASLAEGLSTRRVRLVNDLEAAGHGILGLKSSALATLQAGEPRKGTMALIAAGTGLGEVLLPWDGRRHRVVGSEGGHGDFAPRTEHEIELLRFLHREFGRVSYERVVSGPGLSNIYRFLLASGGPPEAEWLRARMETGDPSAAIAEAALESRDTRAVQALDMFVSVYGAEAGNLALKALALDAVYVGGGIAPKLLAKLKDGMFMKAFADKGRYKKLLAGIPVRVITNPKAALLGAASVAAQLCKGSA